MKKFVTLSTILFFFLSIISNTIAQSPSFSWNVSWGNSEFEFNPSLATDAAGNVYCAGSYKGTLDFDPGPGQNEQTSSFGGFGSDTYISKFDSAGTFLWVKKIGGPAIARSILLDETGYVYVGGDFTALTDFDPGNDAFVLAPVLGSSDVYILTLDLNGNFIDAFQIGGNGQDYFGSMALDHDGNVVVGGFFSGTSDFDPGIGEAIFTSGFF